MDWQCTIKRVTNGYIFETLVCNDDGDATTETLVISEDENNEDGEIEAMHDLLYNIKEHFGIYYSKHNKKNLVIKIK